jgi:hypothetical protein
MKKFFKKYLVDAMSHMAMGLFCSLILGLIISQIAKIPGLGFLDFIVFAERLIEFRRYDNLAHFLRVGLRLPAELRNERNPFRRIIRRIIDSRITRNGCFGTADGRKRNRRRKSGISFDNNIIK